MVQIKVIVALAGLALAAGNEQTGSSSPQTGGSGAATSGQMQSMHDQKPGETQEVQGKVTEAKKDMVSMTIPEQENRKMQFKASSSTTVKKGSSTIQITDLKAGDEVRASYSVEKGSGVRKLTSIEVIEGSK